MKKRIFALSIAALAILTGGIAASAEDGYSVISDLYAENSIASAEFTVENNSSTAGNLIAALVIYDGDNKVKSVTTKRVTATGKTDISITADIGEDAHIVKSMIWNSDSIRPLTNVRSLVLNNEKESGFAPLSSVRLEEGIFKTSQQTGLDYVLGMDVDRLLAPCFETASLPTPNGAVRYGGWERKGANNWTASSADTFTLAGHSLGHWMSAAAVFAASTGDETVLERLNYAVEQLDYIQRTTGNGYIGGVKEDCFKSLFEGNVSSWANNYWVPWYGIHKIYQGLIDAYNYTGNMQALNVAVRFADWAKDGTDKLSDAQMQTMLEVEYGGMNEIFAELYDITGNIAYLETARRFTHDNILNPLANGKDELSGLHANTQIPKIIGAAAIYEDDKEKYADYGFAARFFWNTVVNNRSYVTGGNSISEHFEALGLESLGVKTTETCNTYNMLKLTEHLFDWDHNSAYMDYYERALYNHILGSQDPDTGNKMYFVSLLQGHYRIYGTAHDSFWCCTGTGMENPGKYAKTIYYKENNELYVNLYIPSVLKWEEKGLTLRQETNYPYSDTVKIIIEEGEADAAIKLRVPSWAKNGAEAVYGEKTYSSKEAGYLTIEGSFKKGDVIELTIPMSLEKYVSRGGKAAFMYGPIVLAAPLGSDSLPNDTVEKETGLDSTTVDVPYIVYEGDDVNNLIGEVDRSSLTFKINGEYTSSGEDVLLVPFYSIHHQFHNVYWNMNEAGDVFEKNLNNSTIDSVEPDGQQDELGHNMTGVNTHNGSFSSNGKNYMWRDAWGSADACFSYDLNVEEGQNYLCAAYWGSDVPFTKNGIYYTRDFSIYVDGVKIGTQTVNNNSPGAPYYCFYEIPEELTRGKSSVTVKFAVNSASCCAGGILDLRTTRKIISE